MTQTFLEKYNKKSLTNFFTIQERINKYKNKFIKKKLSDDSDINKSFESQINEAIKYNLCKLKESKNFLIKEEINQFIFSNSNTNKRNQTKKDKLLFLYIIMNLIISVISLRYIKQSFIPKYSYITLKIKGIGNKYIF